MASFSDETCDAIVIGAGACLASPPLASSPRAA